MKDHLRTAVGASEGRPRTENSSPWQRMAAVLGAGMAAGVVSLFAQVGDRSAIDTGSPPAHWQIPPAPVRTPQESIAAMELPAGFRIEVVAAEPLVQDPIAIAFDARGRLWVLEWPSYNWDLHGVLPGLEPQPRPASRVVRLDDTDGDGRMDRRILFAELDWPRGIQPVNDGVLVFALPDVVLLRDTTGDGRADTSDVVIGGLPIPVNPHAAPSSPLLAMDNWIYALQVGERLRLRDGRREAVPAGRLAGQWGLSQDDYGRLFFSYNQDHVRGSLVPVHYAARNANYAATAGIDVRIGQDNDVWPHAVTPGVNRRAQLRDDGRLRVFTANAAPTVYRATHFPEEFHGNVFVGESAGRLIRRVVLSEEVGVITGRNAYREREFLFSHDERFRPVFTALGPEGALYVADMYRGIIEGNIFLTTFLRNQILDRGLHRPFHGMGRIYRIVHDGRPRDARHEMPADAAGWVGHLAHPNGFWRDTAQRAIVGSRDLSVVPALRRLATSHADDRTRLQALWTIDGLERTDAALVIRLLGDASPHVRAAALRAGEPLLRTREVLRATLALTGDREALVRRQVMFSLGAARQPEAERAMLQLLHRNPDDLMMVDAAMSGMEGRERRVLGVIAAAREWDIDSPGRRAFVSALATAIVNEGDTARVDDVLRLASDDGGQPLWRRVAILNGALASRRTQLDPLPTSLASLRVIREPQVREIALEVIARFTRTPAPATEKGPAPASPAVTTALVEQGRSAYTLCAACHQADGRGLPALAPSLVGTTTVVGPPDKLIDVVLHGRDEDPAYPSMPPLAGLPDEQLAAILTYVRQAWGNAAPAITAQDVRGRRLVR
jgi:mono/diheme cytochrome c family protein/glucose/arabinose dehydrogenase